MLPSPTIQILKRLSLKELKRFGEFIDSPYFNKSSSIKKIYEIVLSAHPDYNSSSLELENFARKIFSTGVYSEKRIQNLCTEFGELLKKFLGYEEMNNNKNYELDIFIANALTRKDLLKIAEKFINKSIKQNDSRMIIDDDKDFYKYRILMPRIVSHSQSLHLVPIDERFHILHESLITQFLRNIFHAAKVFSSEYINNSSDDKKIRISFNDALIESLDMNKFLKYLKEIDHKCYSYIKINYLQHFYSENSINDEQFYELKTEIFKIARKILKEDAFIFIFTILQLVYDKMIKADKKYHKDAFELGVLFCELNIYPNDKLMYFNITSFRDLFTNAIILKEYDWAENFIKEYIQYIGYEYRDNEFNYCNGILSFKRGRFEESLVFFGTVKTPDISYKLHLRYYYLMNYIELNALESARSSIMLLRNFYQNQKDVIPEFIENINESLKYFNEIIKCLEQGRKIDEMIYKEANDGRNFTHKAYILEKMEKLK